MKQIKKLKAKIKKDYEELIKLDLEELSKMELINKAYELAHYNEVEDLFAYYEEDCEWFDKDEIKAIINYDENFIKKVWDTWLDYNRPERYNFFMIEDLIEIIRSAI